MNEKVLVKVSLISSIIGVVAVAFLGSGLKESYEPLYSLDEDGDISFSGTIEKVSERGNVTILSVSRVELVDVVVFGNVNISKGDVFITGAVKDYKGKREVIADKISVR